MTFDRCNQTPKAEAAVLNRLAESDVLFRITISNNRGRRISGLVLRALEAYGNIRAFNRLADLSDDRIEVEPVVAIPMPESDCSAAMAILVGI